MPSDSLPLQLGLPEFSPLQPLNGGRRQTLAAFFWPKKEGEFRDLSTLYHRVTLEDGDDLVLVEDRPENWSPGDPVAVLVHGLTGCYLSSYIQRVGRKLFNSGHLVLRVNLRGCGPGFGLAQQPYHSGRSEDLRQVLHWANRQWHGSPASLVGFSLGANISLKLAGEPGVPQNLEKVVAVSPPLDLAACTRKMSLASNRVFSSYFTHRLVKEVKHIERLFESAQEPMQKTRFPRKMSLRDFDELYTAPKSGFAGADDYYQRCSSAQFVPEIDRSTLILSAADDPVIDNKDFLQLPDKPNLHKVFTPRGGHVAFLGETSVPQQYHWMDELVVRWLNQ